MSETPFYYDPTQGSLLMDWDVEGPASWIGSDSVSLTEDPGDWYGDWSGTIGSDSVSLYEDPDGLYGTGPRVAAAVIPILASSTP